MSRLGLLEDNATIARLAATMLTYVGHEVIVYEHPADCLKALALPDECGSASSPTPALTRATLPVELLILDLHLPEINSLSIIELLRSQPHTKSLPLVFCTAATDHVLQQAFQLAPQAWLVEKPFKMDELVKTVTSALQESF
jgi:CheY-like chemotaxis protein